MQRLDRKVGGRSVISSVGRSVQICSRIRAAHHRKETPMSKLLTLAVVLCVAAAPAAAEDIVITQYKADPSGAPYAVAIEKGFFKQAGIDITGVISGAGGGTSVRSAIASPLGFGDVSPAPVISAIEAGQDIKIVNQGSRSLTDNVVIVMPNSPIKSVKELKGKKFAISNPKSLGEMTAVLVFEQAGLKPDDVQRVALGGLSGALTALENGVVDATSIPGILFLMRGGESKYRVLLGPSELPLLPPAIGMATGDLIKKSPEKLKALLAGRRAGVKFIYEHTDEAIAILGKIYEPLPPKDVATLVHQLVAAKFWSEGRIEMQGLRNAARAMKYVGSLEKEIDLGKMIDTSFLPGDLQAPAQ
jgi:NitT/TauT family transport system substrate-binding protein